MVLAAVPTIFLVTLGVVHNLYSLVEATQVAEERAGVQKMNRRLLSEKAAKEGTKVTGKEYPPFIYRRVMVAVKTLQELKEKINTNVGLTAYEWEKWDITHQRMREWKEMFVEGDDRFKKASRRSRAIVG